MSVPTYYVYCHTRLELGFWIQAVLWRTRVGSKISFDQPTQPPGSWIFFWILNPWCFVLVCPHLSCLSRHLCLSPPIMYVPRFMSVPTYFVCPNLLCLSPPIMSVPTFYVCLHLLCLSPPFMSVPTFYVCPRLLCLSPPFMSVPTHHFFVDKPFLNLECGTSSPTCSFLFSVVYFSQRSGDNWYQGKYCIITRNNGWG